MNQNLEKLQPLAMHDATVKTALTLLERGEFADLETCAVWLAIELARQRDCYFQMAVGAAQKDTVIIPQELQKDFKQWLEKPLDELIKRDEK